MRTLLLVAALTSAAAAAPAYPIRIAPVSQTERAHRKADFERREPIHWSAIVVNSRGLVVHLATEDPAFPATLNGVELGPVIELLRREAGSFGIDAADLAGDFRRIGSCARQLRHERHGVLLGRIDINCAPVGDHLAVVIDVIPWLDASPTLEPDDILPRVLGGRYSITTTMHVEPARDCHRGRRCPKPHVETHNDVVELMPDDLVAVDSAVFREGNTLRLVYCIDATWNSPQPGKAVRPQGTAKPLPFVVDAITGVQIPLHVPTCAAIPSID